MTKRAEFDSSKIYVDSILPASGFYAAYFDEDDGTLFWDNLVGWARVTNHGKLESRALRPLDFCPDPERRGDVGFADTRPNFVTVLSEKNLLSYSFMEATRKEAFDRWDNPEDYQSYYDNELEEEPEEELKPELWSQYNELSDKYQELLKSVVERPMIRYNNRGDYYCLFCYGHGKYMFDINHIKNCFWLKCQRELDPTFTNGERIFAD